MIVPVEFSIMIHPVCGIVLTIDVDMSGRVKQKYTIIKPELNARNNDIVHDIVDEL